MAMTQEQLEAMLVRFTQSQSDTLNQLQRQNHEQQQASHQNQMQLMTQLLDKSRDSSREAAAAAATAAASVNAAASAGAGSPGSAESNNRNQRSKGDRQLDTKHFTRVDKYDGGEAAWGDWRNDMEVIINSINAEFSKLMTAVHAQETPVDPAFYQQHASDWADEAQNRSRELLGILFILITSEGKALVKSQADGLEAWRILCNAYSRKT